MLCVVKFCFLFVKVMPPVGSVATPFLGKLPNSKVPSKENDRYYATQSPPPIVIKTSGMDPYTETTSHNRGMRSGHMTPPERDVNSRHVAPSSGRDLNSSVPDPLYKSQRAAMTDHLNQRAGGPVEYGTDETDIVYRSMKTGSSTEPLVNSLRHELERLSQRRSHKHDPRS